MNGIAIFAASGRGIARAAYTADRTWAVENILFDRDVRCLAYDPGQPRIIFAGTREGVLRSTDRGRIWDPSGMEGESVTALAVSPHHPQTILAGTKPAYLYRSDDGGCTWRELEGFRRIPNRWWWFSPADPPGWQAYVNAISFSPSDPDLVLAGVELGAVVRSEDGGETWSRHRSGALRDCHDLKYHIRDGEWAYEAGGTGGGAACSQDSGDMWEKREQGLAENYGITCAADPERPEVWYVSVAPSPSQAYSSDPEIYLYRSTGGAGWQVIGWKNHPLKSAPASLLTLPDAPGHLYAVLRDGHVMHTSDYGDTWQKLPVHVGSCHTAILSPQG